MNAKQEPEFLMLSVRIPVALKVKLRKAAAIRGHSQAKEIERLLTDQLTDDLALHVQFQHAQAAAKNARFQLACLEKFVLDATGPDVAPAQADRLAKLRDNILRMRVERLAHQKELEENVRARADQQCRDETAPVTSPFIDLLDGDRPVRTQTQLPPYERRWINLSRALQGTPKGTKAQLARTLGCLPAQLSQWLSHPGAKGHRTISAATARQLEHALGVPPASLDGIEPTLAAAKLQQTALDFVAALRPLAQKSKPRRP